MTAPRPRRRPSAVELLALAAAALGLAGGVVSALHRPPADSTAHYVHLMAVGVGDVQVVDLPGVRAPGAVAAKAAGLPDTAPVIGVSAGGRHRAYVVQALTPSDRHVVNDLLGGAPVTVTYCDRSGLAAAFARPEGGGPLDVAVGGWDRRAGCMLLRVGPALYRQDTGAAAGGTAVGPLPYRRHDVARTTWGRWRARHPDTDVYLGDRPLEW